MKVLLFCTCWLPDLDRVFMLQSWLRVARQQKADIQIIDTIGNFQPVVAGAHPGECIFVGTQIGHGSRDGDQDGWGRAFCKGIELAIEGNYDYAVHCEADMACRVDLMDVIALMEKEKKPIAAPWCSQVNAIETGLMFMSVPWLKENRFIERYDWPKIRPEMNVGDRIARQPERVIGKIAGDDYLRLNWYGGRIEHDYHGESILMRSLNNRENVKYFTHVRPWAYDLYTRDSKGDPLPLIRL